MVAPQLIVRLLWNGARAVGAARAASQSGTSRELAKNIVKTAHRLHKTNEALREATTEEQACTELDGERISYTVNGFNYGPPSGPHEFERNTSGR